MNIFRPTQKKGKQVCVYSTAVEKAKELKKQEEIREVKKAKTRNPSYQIGREILGEFNKLSKWSMGYVAPSFR